MTILTIWKIPMRILTLLIHKKKDIENNDIEKEDFYEETNYDLITEEELENIHPDLNHNFPSPTMNSDII